MIFPVPQVFIKKLKLFSPAFLYRIKERGFIYFNRPKVQRNLLLR
ncbi:hypothetical protein TPE_1034 [Treponema pedis str. T A4]|uniref:Uncharacterized protein n=1 Tax=Treponema pedis str. T A4 TaxID=1291379 RepID=S5ZTR2_9SPIR|nr:hypothetical protein TPE_1034 [Treponema pedis str. T A4]